MPEPEMPHATLMHFASDSRSAKAMIGVAVYLTLVAALWTVFDAMVWFVIFLALMAIPALIQLWNNPHSTLSLTENSIHWTSGPQTGGVPLSDIDKIRMDTRWDLSVRITLILVDGSKLRLPPDLAPPHRALETKLNELGKTVQRHHFVVI